MKRILSALLCIYSVSSDGQDLKITPESTTIKEPFNFDTKTAGTTTIKINVTHKLASPPADLKYTVSINKEKTSYKGDMKLSDETEQTFGTVKSLDLTVGTSPYPSEEKIVLNLSYVTSNTKTDIIGAATITVENTYPVLGIAGEKKSPWREAREAELFLGKNFDFIDNKVKTTDWYGGFRFFLPAITSLKIGKKNPASARIGIFGGLYQSKSFSRTSFPALEENQASGTYIFERIVSDTYTNQGKRAFKIERDSVKLAALTSIKNLGFYSGFTYLLNKPDVETNNGIFWIYGGIHLEVIRRSVAPTISSLDTLKRNFQTRYDTTRGGVPSYTVYPPIQSSNIYTDAYFGLTLPMQYRWKDMLTVKLTPTVGYSNNKYQISKSSDGVANGYPQKWFYLAQFDMLIKIGGLSANLGGEIRGYFPKGMPIATAYLGTAFSIDKIIDFISK